MTLAEMKHLLNKSRKQTWGVAMACGVAAYVIALTIPTYYSATSSLYLHNSTISPISSFTYDGYYAQLAAEGYTDTVVGLFDTPEFSQRAVNRLLDEGIAGEIHIKGLLVEKVAPQIVSVTYVSADSREAKLMVMSAVDTTVNLVERLNDGDAVLFSLEVLEEVPMLTTIHYPPLLIAGITFLVVIFFASGLLITHTYLSGNDQNK